MLLSVEETLIYFDYTYLTSHIKGHMLSLKFHLQHFMQMVTEIQQCQKTISSLATPKCISKRKTAIQLGKH
jgi:hypothetical protein